MRKVSCYLLAIMLLASSVAYGAIPDINYQEKAEYLHSMDLLEGYGNSFALDRETTRAEAAVMTLRMLGKGDVAWLENDSHPFKDVPEWATREIGYMYINGLVSGVSKDRFGSNNTANANDYTTLMLRTLGYSDKNGDFKWKDSLEFALKIGLISKAEYDSLMQPGFTRADMVLLSYNTVKLNHKNPYTGEYLDQLVANTAPSEEVTAFRNQNNARRNGLLKYSFKYFDVYYPNTDAAKACLELIKPHADKAYMMLCDLYGKQAKVEVHLIDENDAANLREGDIRRNEKVTFVWLEANNDANGNNLAELIHEINHNFFDEANGSATNTMWINEANAKLISSLYTENNYSGLVDQWSFYELSNMKSMISEPDMTIEKADQILKVERAWDGASGEKEQAQRYGLYYWMKIFNTVGTDDFKYYLRNLGNGQVLPAIEKLTGRTAVETDKWLEE